jgi:ATP-dependent DNA helicase RecG
VPTKEEILKLLDKLDDQCADDLETEELEFKPWNRDIKSNQKCAREYSVCFANAKGGIIVFGIEDKIKGRTKAIRGCIGYDVDTFRTAIYQGTMPNILIQIEELTVPEGTLILVHVPSGNPDTTYATSEGLHKIRVEKTCQPLLQSNHRRQRMSIGAIDWSGEPAEGVAVDDLDPLEIERYRNTLRAQAPESDLLRLPDEELLRAVQAVVDGRVCNAGVLMFARKDVLQRVVPQHELILVIHKTPTEIQRELLKLPVLAMLYRMTEVLLLPEYNSVQQLSVDLFILEIPWYPKEVLREALLNAIVHRDYTEQGQVYVRLEKEELTFSNPGGFIGGITPKNILTHEARQRNKRLAEMVEKSRLVERAGIGRRRIFIPMLSFGKRMPRYTADQHTVTLTLFGGSFNENVARYVGRKQKEGVQFEIVDLILLNYLADRDSIDVQDASEICQREPEDMRRILDGLSSSTRKLLEKRGGRRGTYHLDRTVAVELLGKARYSQMRDIEAVRFPEMIKHFVAIHGSISNKECRELLKLGDSNTAQVKASQILGELAGADGFLVPDPNGGKFRNRRYILRDELSSTKKN